MKKHFLLFLLLPLFLGSCNDLSDIENRVDAMEQQVKNLQETLDALEKACNNSLAINSVEPLLTTNGGWVITFSNGKTIEVVNGTKEYAPYLLVDQNGFWCVSYDGGVGFTRIMDSAGNYIKAKSDDGEEISVKVSVDKDGHYVFVLYNKTAPEVVIDTIGTPYRPSSSRIIESISQDDLTNIITITLGNGKTFVFNKEYALPASIAILSTKGVVLGAGTTAQIEFRVNPSNARFNYDVESPECEIELDFIGSTRSGYTTAPENYKLSKVELVYDKQGVVKKGQYRAHITDLNVAEGYSEDVALVLTVNNMNNEQVQISSTAFNVMFSENLFHSFSFLKQNNANVIYDVEVPINGTDMEICTPLVTDASNLVATFTTTAERVYVNHVEQISGVTANDFTEPVLYTVVSADGNVNTYNVSVSNTGLPVVVIETAGEAAIPPKTEDWLAGTFIKIYNADGVLDYEGTEDNIRGRGNSTWEFPKKPYAIKLDKKASILGMPKHKRWVLLANWMDRTMLRNSVAFRISELTELEWTPRGQSVEVIVNGKHAGNYYLCEQIKIDENRVNVNELSDTDVEGDAITGGYLMELDTYFDEVNKFKSEVRNLPYMFKEPDEETLNSEQFAYMQDYVNDLEKALYDDNLLASSKYAEYIDIDSYIDWWFVYELAQNSETGHPKSCYMFKDKSKKMKAGPVWDFDCATFKPNVKNYSSRGSIYYPRLFMDPVFVQRVKDRWAMLKPGFETIGSFIDEQKNKLQKSADINIGMWPISIRVNEDEELPFEDAVDRMKTAYNEKLQWLDAQITNM